MSFAQKLQVWKYFPLALWHTVTLLTPAADGILFFPRGGSFGYLAAVATPLDLPYRNVYVAFNFESNYGLPSNDSYNEWIDRWNLDESFLGIGNNVTPVNNRQLRARRAPRYTRSAFYRSFAGYMEYFGMNGTACLLRTICEVAANSLDENNGLLGGLFKILFMPTTSMPEKMEQQAALPHGRMYEAEWRGENDGDCTHYKPWCPQGFLSMISRWL